MIDIFLAVTLERKFDKAIIFQLSKKIQFIVEKVK